MQLTIPERFQNDIDIAVKILKQEGCESIYLFGSLVTGNIHENSDIDIGIKGLPKGKFFKTLGRVSSSTENEVDIVNFDFSKDFFSLLTRIGEVIKIG